MFKRKYKMKTRKLILLTAIAVLAVIYAIQLAVTGRSPVKTFKMKESPDSLTISSNGETLSLTLDGGLWYVGEEKSAADDSKVEELVAKIKAVKTLGTVSRSSAQSELERYGFADVTTIIVAAQKNEKTLRTFTIGKNAASGNSYIRFDSSSETLLAGENLRSVFDLTADDLKMKAATQENASDSVATPENAESSENKAELKTL